MHLPLPIVLLYVFHTLPCHDLLMLALRHKHDSSTSGELFAQIAALTQTGAAETERMQRAEHDTGERRQSDQCWEGDVKEKRARL